MLLKKTTEGAIRVFFLAGIQSKLKPLGVWERAACPVCGAGASLHVIYKYMTPHIFFIPTFRFHREYVASCSSCASMFRVLPEKGNALADGEDAAFSSGDLELLQNNFRPGCPVCGGRNPVGQSYCGRCGAEL